MDAVQTMAPARRAVHGRSRWWIAAIITGGLVAIIALAVYLAGEPARRYAEAELNRRLKGYSVRIEGLQLHPLAVSVSVRGMTVRQEQHPEPPVAVLPLIEAGLHWRALLHGRVVGDIGVDDPRLHIDRWQFEQEMDDEVPIEDKGFQQAVDFFPLKINEVRVSNGTLTYIDDRQHPLELKRLDLLATNIRNVTTGEQNPSTLWLDAILFDDGKVRLDGRADFLASPVTYDADLSVASVPLEKLGPITQQANIQMSGGVLTAEGHTEATAKEQNVRLKELRIDKVKVEYLHSAATEKAEAERLEKAKAATEEIARKQDFFVFVDHLAIRDSTFGYIDRMEKPEYRLFLSDADLQLWDLSTKSGAEPTRLALEGKFMDKGPTNVDAAVGEHAHEPTIDLSLQIEQTPMTAMNDLFRRYGNFDVVGGEFAFYTQLKVADRRIEGYVKPMFSDVDVFDKRQDAEKAFFRQTYERLVGGVAGLLENKQEAVATEANVRGRAESPRYSLWQIIANLVRNAFIKSILPGFERSVIGDEERG